jgi:hypothetical protein
MNRRNFFKRVTCFVTGVCAVVVPKAIGSKRSGARPATKKELQDILTQVVKEKLKPLEWPLGCKDFREELERIQIMQAERMAFPAYMLYPDGHCEQIAYQEFYKID